MNCERAEFGLPRMPAEEKSEPSSLESLGEAIEGIREIPGTEGFYNAAAWETNGTTYLLGRQVNTAGGEGEPDSGSLVLKTLGPDGKIASSKEVWRPKVGEHLLEDVRALLLPDGRIVFGLTYVVREGDNYIPHPTVLMIRSVEELEDGLSKHRIIKFLGGTALGRTITDHIFTESLLSGTTSELKVVKDMIGDQTTPLGEVAEIILTGKNVTAIGPGPNLVAFRPEGDDNNHRLRVLELQQEDDRVTHKQYLDFPNSISWAEHRIGTTMPPVWLNKNEAFLPIHGIKIVDGKYIYSIGTARLVRDEDGTLSVDNISQEPIIDPDLFNGMFGSDEIELHSERRVVYCCGGIPICNDSGELEHLKMYVNVGDKRTVEVTISMGRIIKGWQRNGVDRNLVDYSNES